MNSLTLLIAFLLFITFGYISLGRMSYKYLFRDELGQPIQFDQRLALSILSQLGFSTLFYAMPAISVALFWGWLPALLWLLVAHLFAEFLFNTQLSYSIQEESSQGIALYTQHESNSGPRSMLLKLLTQCYLIIMMAISLTYIVKLADLNAGILFCLLMLIPAQAIFKQHRDHNRLLLISTLSIIPLGLGLILSHHIGLTFHGNWTPWHTALPWLSANHATLNAAILIFLVRYLNSKPQFKQDLAHFSGALFIILLVILLVNIAWLRPILDAPLQSTHANASTPPWFIATSGFLLLGAISTIMRLFIPQQGDSGFGTHSSITANLSAKRTPNHRNDFFSYQTSSLLILLFMACLFSVMAAAVGIGAWDTHFLTWSNQQNLVAHWQLVLSSLQALIDPQADLGWLNTLLICGLSCIGFCSVLLITSALTQLADVSDNDDSLISYIGHAQNTQTALLSIFSLLFIHHGVSINTWLLLGVIAWLLLCVHISRNAINSSTNQRVFIVFSIAMIGIGLLQTGILITYWLLQQQVPAVLMLATILVIGMILLYPDCKKIISLLKNQKEKALFE